MILFLLVLLTNCFWVVFLYSFRLNHFFNTSVMVSGIYFLHFLSLFFVFTASCSLMADVNMPGIFSDNMMLQRGLPNPVWGTADPGEEISISIHNQQLKVKADEKGQWKATLKSIPAGGPYELIVVGKNSLYFKNVLVGDIWICSGQSNMEWPVIISDNGKQEVAQALRPQMRLFTVPKKAVMEPEEDMEGEWKVCNPSNVADFSAVGYYFGRLLQDSLQIPIGLIDASWGGTLIETWISENRLKEVSGMSSKINSAKEKNAPERRKTLKERLENIIGPVREENFDKNEDWESPENNFSGWKPFIIPRKWEAAGLEDLNGVLWLMKEFELTEAQANGKEAILNLGPIDDSDISWINGIKAGETNSKWNRAREYKIPRGVLKAGRNVLVVKTEDTGGDGGFGGTPDQINLHTQAGKVPLAGEWKVKAGKIDFGIKPNQNFTSLFNGMINPLIPFGIKGVIWYQGESNAGQAYRYRQLMTLLIDDWRSRWGAGEFPFLMVQLANYGKDKDVAEPGKSQWAELREAQLLTTQNVPNTGMAVTIDIGQGDDIHPRNKQEVGRRLGLYALAATYGRKTEFSGPVYKSFKTEGNQIKIYFDHVGKGLEAKGGALKGFAVAGEDGKYKWADAKIEGDVVMVSSADVKNPKNVRYAWQDNPEYANLYNKAGLPASPFRTDGEK